MSNEIPARLADRIARVQAVGCKAVAADIEDIQAMATEIRRLREQLARPPVTRAAVGTFGG